MKFKVGDKVEIVNNNLVNYGRKGIIKDLYIDCMYILEFDGFCIRYNEDDLILVASSQNVTNKIKDSSIYLDKITLPTIIREEDIVGNIDSNCSHKWKLYNGFTESYEYCELCDKKRGT